MRWKELHADWGLLEWSERVSRVVQGKCGLRLRMVVWSLNSTKVRAHTDMYPGGTAGAGEFVSKDNTDRGSTFQSRTVGSGDDYKRNMEGQAIQMLGRLLMC